MLLGWPNGHIGYCTAVPHVTTERSEGGLSGYTSAGGRGTRAAGTVAAFAAATAPTAVTRTTAAAAAAQGMRRVRWVVAAPASRARASPSLSSIYPTQPASAPCHHGATARQRFKRGHHDVQP
jgi:hypothetical protein